MIRDFIRYGIRENQTAEDLARIFQEQVEWLKETGEIIETQNQPQGQKPEGDRKGSP